MKVSSRRQDLSAVAALCFALAACTSNPPTPETTFRSSLPAVTPSSPVRTVTSRPSPDSTASPFATSPRGSINAPRATASTGSHVVEVLVGGGSQPVTERAGVTDVLLKQPSGIAVGSIGDSTVQGAGNIYITDSGLGIEFRVWQGGQVLDVLGGMATPEGLTITGEGMSPGYPVIADPGDNVVVVPTKTSFATFAGDASNPGFGGDGGPPEKASLSAPHDVATGPGANCSFYIADTGNNRIRIVEPGRTCESDWVINTVAGDGRAGFQGDGFRGTVSELNAPEAVLADGGWLLIADTGNHRIRAMEMGGGAINTIVGNGRSDPVGRPGARDRSTCQSETSQASQSIRSEGSTSRFDGLTSGSPSCVSILMVDWNLSPAVGCQRHRELTPRTFSCRRS